MQKINTQNTTHPRVILLPVFHSFRNASAHACWLLTLTLGLANQKQPIWKYLAIQCNANRDLTLGMTIVLCLQPEVALTKVTVLQRVWMLTPEQLLSWHSWSFYMNRIHFQHVKFPSQFQNMLDEQFFPKLPVQYFCENIFHPKYYVQSFFVCACAYQNI